MPSPSRIDSPDLSLAPLTNSLRCLSKPSVIASVLVLILNDHVLKVYFPSFLSGKLSDFAGLYFFPFLLAPALSLILPRQFQDTRKVGLAAIGITGLAFTGIKTVPGLNAWAEGLIQTWSGAAVVVQDPTDITALVSLPLSWTVWKQNKSGKSPALSWMIFLAAAGATLATSCRYPSVITTLHVRGGSVYAQARRGEEWFLSDDLGQNWERVTDLPPHLQALPGPEPDLPKTICDSRQPDRCLRISGEEFVEESLDGGASWSRIWEIPPGRREVMDRLAASPVCPKTIDLGPYDAVFAGPPSGRVALIALGNEGILRITDQGPQPRVPVAGYATPTPYLAFTFQGAFNLILPELTILLIVSLIWWVIQNLIYWPPVLDQIQAASTSAEDRKWVLQPMLRFLRYFLVVFAVAGILAASGLVWTSPDPTLPYLLAFLALALIVLPIMGQLSSWARLASLSTPGRIIWRSLGALMTSQAAFLGLGALPFFFWAANVIHFHEIAVLWAVLLDLIVISTTIFWLRSRASVSQECLSTTLNTNP